MQGLVEVIVGVEQRHARRQAQAFDIHAHRLCRGIGHPQAFAAGGQAVGIGVGQQQDEFLAAVACQHVAFSQAGPRHGSKGLQHTVAGGVAMDIVDALEVVQVDQRQAVALPLTHFFQRAAGQTEEMSAVEQPGEFVGGHQVLELTHHAAQRVLVRLQRIPALAHALAQRLHVAGEQAQPGEYDEQHQQLQHGLRRQLQALLEGFVEVQPGEGDEGQRRTTGEHPGLQLEDAEQQDQHVEHHQRATRGIHVGQEQGVPDHRHQYLRLGHARVGEALVAPGEEQPAEHQLTAGDQQGAGQGKADGRTVELAEHGQPQQQQRQGIGPEGHAESPDE